MKAFSSLRSADRNRIIRKRVKIVLGNFNRAVDEIDGMKSYSHYKDNEYYFENFVVYYSSFEMMHTVVVQCGMSYEYFKRHLKQEDRRNLYETFMEM